MEAVLLSDRQVHDKLDTVTHRDGYKVWICHWNCGKYA